ncbi:MAG: FecR domain-containing protein [Myxococcota bacterium]
MSLPPDPVQRVAEVLRRHPPVPDDLSRVRAERNVVQASRRALLAPPPSPRRRALKGVVVAGTLTAAAAALVLFWGGPEDDAAGTDGGSLASRSTAKELMEASLVAEGMPAQGETLRTGAGQRMRAHIGASEVELEPNTRAHFERLAPEEFRVRLRSGALRTTFHPKLESEQRMVVTTRAARVEVVGTVFRVEVDGADATGVWVEEGKVRVVPTAEGAAPRFVSKGDALRVEPTGTVPVEVLGGRPASAAEVEGDPRPDAGPAGPETTTETGAGAGDGADGENGAKEAKRAPDGAGAPDGKRNRVRGRVVLPGGDHLPGFVRAKDLLAEGRFAAARRLLRNVVDRKAESRTTRTRAWVLIAESYEEQGNHGRAAEAYGKASWFGARTRAGLDALFRLGQLREGRLGDARGARNAYTRYLQQAPHGPKAPNVRRALCRLGDRSHC